MKYNILTPFQQTIFEALAKEPIIRENFIFSGGTALSEYYLQHRLSEDFDFFANCNLDLDELKPVLLKAFESAEITVLEYRQYASSKIFFLKKGQREVVKTDFNIFPYHPVSKPIIRQGLKIDGLLDITLTKLDTILTRQKSRDYIDFYFIQQRQHYSFDMLLKKLQEKVEWRIDPLFLAVRLTKFDDLKDYPNMLIPFSIPKISSFYWELADSLKEQLIK